MALFLGPEQAPSDERQALTIGPVAKEVAYINLVCDHPVFLECYVPDPAGEGKGKYRPEGRTRYLNTTQLTGVQITNVSGLRVWSADAAHLATVQAELAFKSDPQFDGFPSGVPAGAGGLQFGGINRVYAPDNEGGWLYVKANEHTDTVGIEGEFGIQLHDATGQGFFALSGSPAPLSPGFATLVGSDSEVGMGYTNNAGIQGYVIAGKVGAAGELDIAVAGGAGTIMRFLIGAHQPLALLASGLILVSLPSVPGPTGTLYQDAGGFVKVSP